MPSAPCDLQKAEAQTSQTSATGENFSAAFAAMEEKRKGDLKQEALLQGLKKKPNVTLDGKEIKVYANIGTVSIMFPMVLSVREVRDAK